MAAITGRMIRSHTVDLNEHLKPRFSGAFFVFAAMQRSIIKMIFLTCHGEMRAYSVALFAGDEKLSVFSWH